MLGNTTEVILNYLSIPLLPVTNVIMLKLVFNEQLVLEYVIMFVFSVEQSE